VDGPASRRKFVFGIVSPGASRWPPQIVIRYFASAPAMKKRAEDIAARLGTFLKEYRRKKRRGWDPNDRQYDRRVESLLRRLSPEEVDRVINDDGNPAAK
jgi:hypothetical protein